MRSNSRCGAVAASTTGRVTRTSRPAERIPEYVRAESGDHRRKNGDREVHVAGARQSAGSQQHGNSWSGQSGLHGKRPCEYDGDAVRGQ